MNSKDQLEVDRIGKQLNIQDVEASISHSIDSANDLHNDFHRERAGSRRKTVAFVESPTNMTMLPENVSYLLILF